MKSFILILVGLLMSCGGAQDARNSELTAEYYGVVEVRAGGAYIDEATLRQLLKQNDKPIAIKQSGVAFNSNSLKPYLSAIGTMKKNLRASNGLKPKI